MGQSVHPDQPSARELARRFAAEGFDLAVGVLVTGRHLATATNAALGGAGPVATGNTATEAAHLAWSRYIAHRGHYLSAPAPDSTEDGSDGSPLRRLRRARGISQRRLARAADISVSTINRLELDRRAVPTAPTRAAIANALGVTVGDVFPEPPR